MSSVLDVHGNDVNYEHHKFYFGFISLDSLFTEMCYLFYWVVNACLAINSLKGGCKWLPNLVLTCSYCICRSQLEGKMHNSFNQNGGKKNENFWTIFSDCFPEHRIFVFF